jgi:hypothetical protein
MLDSIIFILGILSLAQLLFLPGFLVTRLLGVRGLLASLLYSMGLSLLINHILIFLLTALGWYKSNAVYGIFFLELMLFWWFERELLRTRVFQFAALRSALWEPSLEVDSPFPQWEPAVRRLAAFSALLTILGFLIYAVARAYPIFSAWDAVGSWNSWAWFWSQNVIAPSFGDYPQLLPTAYSLTYVFMGTAKIQFFAKALASAFPIGILLAMFDLGLRMRMTGFFIGIVATGLLLSVLNKTSDGNLVASGYADVPGSFFSFMVMHGLLRARSASKWSGQRNFIILAAFMAAAASLTKQTGLFMAAAFPLLTYVLCIRHRRIGPPGRPWTTLCLSTLAMILCVLPWYVYKHIQLASGAAQGNFQDLLVNLHAGRNFAQRFVYGIKLMHSQVGGSTPSVALLVFNLWACAYYPAFCTLVLLILPFFLLWAIGFSYDLRNLAMIVPFLGLGAGIGLEQNVIVICRLFSIRSTVPRPERQAAGDRRGDLRGPRWWHVLVSCIVLLIGLNAVLSKERLEKQQIALQKKIGDRALNRFLYQHLADGEIDGLIATNYSLLQYLPGFEKSAAGLPLGDLPRYRQLLARPDVKYFLLPEWRNPAYDPGMLTDFLERVSRLELQPLYRANGWILARKQSREAREEVETLATAEALIEQKCYSSALGLLQKLDTAAVHDRGRACYLLALSLEQSTSQPSKLVSSLDWYDQAGLAGYRQDLLHYRRGLLLTRLGRPRDASRELMQAYDMSPSNPEVRRMAEEFAPALVFEAIQKPLSLSPANPQSGG